MRKILLIATELAPGMKPFAATIINTLVKSDELNVFSVVVNSRNKTYIDLLEKKEKTTCIEYPENIVGKLFYKVYPKRIIDAIVKLDKEHHFDAIHLLTGDFSLAFFVWFYKNHDRFYYTIHDLHPHAIGRKPFLWMLLRKYIIFCNKINRTCINNLTTSSYGQYIELKTMFPHKRIVFTHFPSLITKQIIEGDKIVPELKEIDNYILFMGSVEYYKGVDLLVKAFRDSKLLSSSVKLVIAGKGEIYDENINIIRLNRFIHDDEIADLFRRARFVVYPYRTATMSGVLSIAFYFKKNVILSDIPFFRDNKTSDCVYFKKGDYKDLKDKMEQLYVDNKAITEDSYNKIYSEHTLMKDYLDLYK